MHTDSLGNPTAGNILMTWRVYLRENTHVLEYFRDRDSLAFVGRAYPEADRIVSRALPSPWAGPKCHGRRYGRGFPVSPVVLTRRWSGEALQSSEGDDASQIMGGTV